ncbi:MAG: RHS repeat-associated core domain-containing protein [Parachlamydiaceae bacterium]|nr:RHS repeat-associated core domain-containing protein [Parachlamydiaceae bacterium]
MHLLSRIDPNGNVTHYTYDGAGRKSSETYVGDKNNNSTTIYEYDSHGRVHKITQPFGENLKQAVVQIMEYDALDRTVEERTEDESGKLFQKKCFTYDIVGNITSVIVYQDASTSLISTTVYDSHNNPVFVKDALANITHYAYNYGFKNGESKIVFQKTTTDPNGIKTIDTYDVSGRLEISEKRNSLGILLSKETIRYDLNGNTSAWIESVIQDGQEKRMISNRKEFGPENRLEMIVEAEGTVEQKITHFSYNSMGQQDAVTKPTGTVLNSVYDPHGRLTEYTSSDKSIAYTYVYDNVHNLIRIDDKINGTTTHRTYDPLNQMIKEVLGNGIAFAFTYDQLGRRTQVQLPDQSSIKYVYDAAHLRTVVRLDSKGNKKYEHRYDDYDLLGQEATLQSPSKAGTEKRRYDALKRRTSTSTTAWKETIPEKGYDRVGNLCNCIVEDKVGKINYQFSYDDLNQVSEEKGHQTHKYAYDSLNNCITKDGIPRSHNALNQLLSDGASQFSYDLNGNLVECMQNGVVTKYEYDALDRLITVTQNQKQTRYQYDHFHRRLKKEHFVWNDKKRFWEPPKDVQHFLYIDQDEIGSVDAKGNLQELRILGKGLGAEVGAAVAIEVKDRLLVPVHNLRGDICCLLDAATSKVCQTYRYSAYGERFSEDGVDLIPWGFASKRYDSESGLVYFGRRYYAPHLGRWMTADPLGFADGPNLYAYVHNNPLTHFDLYGLFALNFSNSFKNEKMGVFGNNFNSSLSKMSGRNFSRPASKSLSWSRYSCDTAFSCGSGLSQGFLDPVGTLSGYGKNLWNYNYSGKTWGQIGRDCNQHVFTAERLGEVGGLALNCVAVTKGVQAGIKGGSAAYGISRQFFGRQTVKQVLTRTKIKNYLSNIESCNKNQIISDIKSIGLQPRGKSPDGKFMDFTDKQGKLRVKIHPSDKVTKYDHLHLYDKRGNSLNKYLEIVDRTSADAHIPYGG